MFGKKLEEARNKANLSRKELASILHVGQNTVWRWENGEREPSLEKIQSIARALGVTTDELMTEHKNAPASQSSSEGNIKDFAVEVPHYGMNTVIRVPVFPDYDAVCAGYGTQEQEGIAQETIDIPAYMAGGSYSLERGRIPFVVRVSGDSMEEAKIPDGSQVLVNPLLEVHSGEVAYVVYYGTTMIKWVYWDRNGGGELRSATLRYPSKTFTRQDVNEGNVIIKGRVVIALTAPKHGE